MIKKYSIEVLFLLLVVLSFYAAQYYNGNAYIFILFSIVSHLLLLNGFSKGSIYFDTFIGIFFWLGFWLKTAVRITFADGKFIQAVGNFDFTPEAFDTALLVSSCGMCGFIFASIIRRKCIFNYPQVPSGPSELKIYAFYNNNRSLVLVLFTITVMIIGLSNMHLGIYQRGEIPATILPFGLNGIYKWLLQFGLATITATILYFEFYKKNTTGFLVSTIGIFECFISNISLLSRGMILNISSLIIGVYRFTKDYKIHIKPYYRVSMLLACVILFMVSIFIVNHIRHVNKKETELVGNNVVQNVIANNSSSRIKVLLIDRWVGIEGVMAISSYPNKGWGLFNDALNEKFSYQKNSFYDENIIISPYIKQDKSKQHYISLPGIISFLFYPGSYIFLLTATLIVGIVAGYLEKFIYCFGGKNIILCALLSQVIAYRLAHFGYVPSQSYLLFGALIFNVLIIYALEKILNSQVLNKIIKSNQF